MRTYDTKLHISREINIYNGLAICLQYDLTTSENIDDLFHLETSRVFFIIIIFILFTKIVIPEKYKFITDVRKYIILTPRTESQCEIT